MRIKSRPCTSGSMSPQDVPRGRSSSQAGLRRPECTAYRCFLPDLTGFTGFRRAGPGSQHRHPRAGASRIDLREGFSLAIADCEYRAPLTPRLARPGSMLLYGGAAVNAPERSTEGP